MKKRTTWLPAALLCAACGTPQAPPIQTAPQAPPIPSPAQPPPLSAQQAAAARAEQPAGPPARTVVVISDLHFGLGRSATDGGSWDAYEDFRWSREWAEFLQQLDAETQAQAGAVDLVINGDAFELWQSRTGDCRAEDKDQGCSAEEALDRAHRILAAHAGDLQRLGQFAMSGQNRVVFVPGNHDAALLFPSVAGAVLQATLASPERISVSPTGYWISRDRRIYADHGHQIGLDPNSYHNWPTPFRQRDDRWYITRPWGEQFMQAFYNSYEDRYPIIDNIAAERDAVRFAIVREGPLGLLQAVGKFVGFTLLKTSWTQRVDLARLQSPSASPPPDANPPEKPSDGRAISDPSSRAQIFGTYLNSVGGQLRAQGVSDAPIDLYVFSHTHNLDVGFEFPTAVARGVTRVVNSGAWQRVVSADWLRAEQGRRQIPERDALVQIHLEDLPPCYGAVRIRPYAPDGRPTAEVFYWHAAPGTPGHFAPTCP